MFENKVPAWRFKSTKVDRKSLLTSFLEHEAQKVLHFIVFRICGT